MLDRPEHFEAMRFTKTRRGDLFAWLRRHHVHYTFDEGVLTINNTQVKKDEYVLLTKNLIGVSKIFILPEWSYLHSVKGGVREAV